MFGLDEWTWSGLIGRIEPVESNERPARKAFDSYRSDDEYHNRVSSNDWTSRRVDGSHRRSHLKNRWDGRGEYHSDTPPGGGGDEKRWTVHVEHSRRTPPEIKSILWWSFLCTYLDGRASSRVFQAWKRDVCLLDQCSFPRRGIKLENGIEPSAHALQST